MTEKTKLIFLGTGSAVPTARKNHPAIFLQYKDENILIDCGEGTQRQFRLAKENPCKLTRILITHWHGDHMLGLPGLLQTLMLNNYNKTLHIYGPQGSNKMLSLLLDLFVSKGNQFRIEIHEITSGKVFETEDFFMEAEPMQHDTPTLAYSFNIKAKSRLDKKKLAKLKIPNGPIIGELASGKTIEFKGKKIDGKKLIYKEDAKKIAFILDTKLNPNCNKIAKDADLLISEATFSKEDKEIAEERMHLTSEQAANIAKQAKAKKLILTHLSQRYDFNNKLILQEAKKVFKNTLIAEDLMKLEL